MTIVTTWRALAVLLHLFWGLAAGAAVTALLPFRSCQVFRAAVRLSASRGKLWDSRPVGALGPFTDWKVPQRWFGHFYVTGLAANILTVSGLALSCGTTKAHPFLPFGMVQLHLVRRCWETYCMLHYPSGTYMHVVAYLFGLLYYAVLPLTFLVTELGYEPACRPHTARREKWSSLSLGIQGAVIFAIGSVLQYHSHRILSRLTNPDNASSGAQKPQYQIPRGGGFDYVSCPHYLGEIVIYVGLALTTNQTRPLTWLPLAWVVSNLLLAAGPTHSWYRRKFEHYPAQRRALIPFLY